MRHLWLSARLAVVVAMAGCYVPVPAEPTAIPPGSELTLELSTQGRDRLRTVAARDDEHLTGQLVSVTADSLTVSTRLLGVSGVVPVNGNLRQPVSFARADIQSVTVPEFHRGRTLAIVGGMAVAAAVVVFTLFDIDGSGGGPDPPPPPPPSPFAPAGR